MKRFGEEKENSGERKKEKKNVWEEKNKWRDSMVREVQRDITLLFENNILNSNHVQSVSYTHLTLPTILRV